MSESRSQDIDHVSGHTKLYLLITLVRHFMNSLQKSEIPPKAQLYICPLFLFF